jgi:pilus assembly protein CpaB
VKSRLLTITLAAVLAVLGVVAVLGYVHQANERAVNGLKAQTVVVATGAIPARTSLSQAQQEHLLSTEKVPDSSLTTPAVQAVTPANEHLVVTGPVAKGQVLLQNMLGTSTSVTASGFVVPPGMVAVTLNLCMDEAVAEYATPGSNVAVFDTIVNANGSQITRTCDAQHEVTNGGAISNANIANTQLVVQKAEVLAVGQNPASLGTSGGSSTTVTTDPSTSSSSSTPGLVQVTLAVKQADAERLILIEELGMPWMALLGSSSNVGFTPPVALFQGKP